MSGAFCVAKWHKYKAWQIYNGFIKKEGGWSFGIDYIGIGSRRISVNRNGTHSQFRAEKTEHKLETAQAVTDCKIDELTREVRLHNNFAQRVPVMEEQIKVINHRIADLEGEK